MAKCSFDFEPEFVDRTQADDCQCPICLQLLKDPYLTSCCGYHFCQTCIKEVKRHNQACPRCKKQNFRCLLDRQLRSKINELKVYCYLRDYGCSWTGSLEQLECHLNLNKPEGECPYVPVQCPHCQTYVQRHQFLTEHFSICPQRPFTCEHCGFLGTHHDVTMVHWLTCLDEVAECPNHCGTSMKRRNIQNHLSMCPLQVVECEYVYAGCTGKTRRQEMPTHMQDNIQSHLDLVTQHCKILVNNYSELQCSYSELQSAYSELQSSYSEIEDEVQYLRAQINNHSSRDSKTATL